MLGSFWKKSPAQTQIAEEDSSDGSSEQLKPSVEEQEEEENEKLEMETWVEWIKRCTHNVEGHLRKASIDDWVVAQRRRKWRLAGHTARREDHRWSETMLEWEPAKSNKRRGHPRKRWTNDMDAFFFHKEGAPRWIWKFKARNREGWQTLEDEFVEKAWYK